MGYSNNKRLQVLTTGVGLGVNAASYNEGSAGAVFRKHLGRSFDFFAAYRFTEVAFPVATCTPGGGGCGTMISRNIGSIGVEWHPTPTRIE